MVDGAMLLSMRRVEALGQQQEAAISERHAMQSSSRGVSVTMHMRRCGLDSDIEGDDATQQQIWKRPGACQPRHVVSAL
jgi:hypothetical protein